MSWPSWTDDHVTCHIVPHRLKKTPSHLQEVWAPGPETVQDKEWGLVQTDRRTTWRHLTSVGQSNSYEHKLVDLYVTWSLSFMRNLQTGSFSQSGLWIRSEDKHETIWTDPSGQISLFTIISMNSTFPPQTLGSCYRTNLNSTWALHSAADAARVPSNRHIPASWRQANNVRFHFAELFL